MERKYSIMIALIVIGLALGLGLGLGLRDDDDDDAVQVYGKVTDKNTTNAYSSPDKTWVYPLYTSEERAKELFGNNYHFHMFEGCDNKYYMSDKVTEHTHSNKSDLYSVNTCGDNLLPPSGSSSGSGSGSGSYGGETTTTTTTTTTSY